MFKHFKIITVVTKYVKIKFIISFYITFTSIIGAVIVSRTNLVNLFFMEKYINYKTYDQMKFLYYVWSLTGVVCKIIIINTRWVYYYILC